jgi:16S rRNA (guanine966-N2)-methyltransferase
MRILAGDLQGVALKQPVGIRPTTGKVRAALFNILDDAVIGSRVADLCAGSGAVGLEALSRGAAHVTWVEADSACAQTLRRNIASARDRAERALSCHVLRADVISAIPRLMRDGLFDLVFFDPPYRDIPLIKKALRRISASDILAPSGWLVVEHSQEQNISQLIENIEVTSSYRYGDTRLTFIRPQEGLS